MSSFTGGNPAGFTGGNAVPGALKTPIPAVWVVCRTEGITQSGIEPEGSNIVVRGSVFTATATRAGYGNFNRFEVNGAFATSAVKAIPMNCRCSGFRVKGPSAGCS